MPDDAAFLEAAQRLKERQASQPKHIPIPLPEPKMPEPVAELPTLRDVACKCRQCGKVFEGVRFFAQPDDNGFVSSLCSGCGDEAEQRNTEKLREMARKEPQKALGTFTEAAPLRRPQDYD